MTDHDETAPEAPEPVPDDPCIHEIWPPASCYLCNGRAAREDRVLGVGDTFAAQHRLFCRDCEEWWEPGALIGRLSTGRYVCALCWCGYEGEDD